ncbi:MAG: glycosyltransferase family 9 protein [Sedimentisphaerales bacterium]|nr:glycosyltransferase family 9 protein [Sedimentisphaerales bacterium]
MENEDHDILEMVGHAEKRARRFASQALIIQPGAIGDCVLTLPLVEFIKTHFNIGTVKILGRPDYTEYFLGRTAIDSIKDIDSVDMHRLFADHKKFELEDPDSLIHTFAGFEQIVTFLGDSGSDFENNLIFTANCSNSVEVTTLKLIPDADFSGSVAAFYLDSFISSQGIDETSKMNLKKKYITPGKTDLKHGLKILESAGIEEGYKITVIHPGSGGEKKCWHIDNFYMLAEHLSDNEIKAVFLLGPAEMERFETKTIDTLGAIAPVLCDLTLTEALQVISCADCFIGNDNGITHMAAAAGVQTIACFGPTDPAQYCPVGPQVTAFKFQTSEFNSPCPDKADQLAKKALELLNS